MNWHVIGIELSTHIYVDTCMHCQVHNCYCWDSFIAGGICVSVCACTGVWLCRCDWARARHMSSLHFICLGTISGLSQFNFIVLCRCRCLLISPTQNAHANPFRISLLFAFFQFSCARLHCLCNCKQGRRRCSSCDCLMRLLHVLNCIISLFGLSS